MPFRAWETIDSPARVALCGESICFRGLAQYLAHTVAEAGAPVEILLDCDWTEDPVGVGKPDALVVCASPCSGHEDPEVFRRAQAKYPNARVVAISPGAHAVNLVTALEAGAKGFVACGVDGITDIVAALVGALEDDIVFSNEVSRLMVTALRRSGVVQTPKRSGDDSRHGLSERESEVLSLLHDGLSNQQIASALGLSPNTVKNHLARLYGKLGVGSRGEAVSLATRAGLL